METLPRQEQEILYTHLGARLDRGNGRLPVETWLQKACGAATQKVTTDEIMALTRGEA